MDNGTLRQLQVAKDTLEEIVERKSLKRVIVEDAWNRAYEVRNEKATYPMVATCIQQIENEINIVKSN